jgi:hypothetical protein
MKVPVTLPVTIGVFALSVTGSPTYAGDSHSSQFSCYAYVHDQCFVHSRRPCDQEGYEWGLDNCDEMYERPTARRPAPPQGLALPTSTSPSLRAKIGPAGLATSRR